VLCKSVPGPVAVKASGSVSERPLIKGYNDVAVDRFDQACRFLASLGLPFALRGSSGEAITDEARSLGPGEFRWHTVRSCELELLFSEGEFFYWSSDLLLTNVRCHSNYSIFTSSMPVVSTLIRTPASRRFVCCTAFHAKMRQSVARTICSYSSCHGSRVHSLDPSIAKTARPPAVGA
jgi:hypothetical protein